jgi:hypothetical protein
LTKSENRKTGGKNRYFAPCVSFAFASHFCPTLSVVVAARGTEPWKGTEAAAEDEPGRNQNFQGGSVLLWQSTVGRSNGSTSRKASVSSLAMTGRRLSSTTPPLKVKVVSAP